MDEITLVNLLNKICEKNRELTWRLKCKYHDGINPAVMQLCLLQTHSKAELSEITFSMETGQVIAGRHRGLIAFRRATNLIDALLDILIFEGSKKSISNN